MPNILSFDVGARRVDGPLIVTPCVDGVALTVLTEQFERSHGMGDHAGGYGGLIPEYFRYGPLDRHFLDDCDEYFRDLGCIYLLGRQCGEVGCKPLTGVVTLAGDIVKWHGFRQSHRPERDYKAFGPFVFDRNQYERTLMDLIGRAPIFSEG